MIANLRAKFLSTQQNNPVILGLLVCITMVAFAANSLLARLAFQSTSIDAISFTVIRLISGASVLFFILLIQGTKPVLSFSNGLSAVLLAIYATTFAYAYRDISTGTGALLLFASAQLTMISYGFFRGERTSVIGLGIALVGLVLFLLPSASSPPYEASALMAVSGLSWGIFSLIGKASGAPIVSTASSFLMAVPICLLTLYLDHTKIVVDRHGMLYAIISGGVASGLGYALWYWVKVRMTTISSGAVQLSVPVISAVLGVLFLDESIASRSLISAVMVLIGVLLVVLTVERKQ